ncbi:HNH endonuclease [Muricauda sp. 334s03]|uniref:HNH endonuclease n=1 Tax=Flagellimonas yonaguniensis TaxID=3031325 RepID=A0ABT5Y0I8_9FLAO|nr:HNH endonuclease [[Muricauda] yonaguniensis]MDF0716958.1 HNH endonuclease [[Muricauda] yonaguniensis]
MKCFFCSNELDGSDEHIILKSLNGRLHSKQIICSACNNFFGLQLDTVAKEFFNPILLVLGLKNASGMIAENLEGEDDYLLRKDNQVVQRRPKMKEIKIQGRTLISIKGDVKNTMKLFKKRVEKLEKRGGKVLASKTRGQYGIEPLRIKAEFKSSPKLALLLNKIAIEYAAFNKIHTPGIGQLALKIRDLDESSQNVFYCDPEKPVREIQSAEITHLVQLWSEDGTIYCYIELFNVVCALLVLGSDYSGDPLQFQYYQDAITGEKLTGTVELDTSALSLVLKKGSGREVDFAKMANQLFERKVDRDFDMRFHIVLTEIKGRLEQELADGKITEKEFAEKFVDESTAFVAECQIDNPYMWEDLGEPDMAKINFIHSNMPESEFDTFCEKNKPLIGKQVRMDGKETYIAEKFLKIPVAEHRGIQIVKVCVVLFNGLDRLYMPYREFFEGILNK